MSVLDVLVLVLLGCGTLLTLIAAIGLVRLPDVISRMHAASKPQTLGLVLVCLGMAVAVGTWQGLGYALLVVAAQLVTVPVSSAMLGRATFRRGFVYGGQYAIDELSPRLVRDDDEDQDEDGFVDELAVPEATDAEQLAESFPENRVEVAASEDLAGLRNWEEPEAETPEDDSMLGLDVDLGEETEVEAEGASRTSAD